MITASRRLSKADMINLILFDQKAFGAMNEFIEWSLTGYNKLQKNSSTLALVNPELSEEVNDMHISEVERFIQEEITKMSNKYPDRSIQLSRLPLFVATIFEELGFVNAGYKESKIRNDNDKAFIMATVNALMDETKLPEILKNDFKFAEIADIDIYNEIWKDIYDKFFKFKGYSNPRINTAKNQFKKLLQRYEFLKDEGMISIKDGEPFKYTTDLHGQKITFGKNEFNAEEALFDSILGAGNYKLFIPEATRADYEIGIKIDPRLPQYLLIDRGYIMSNGINLLVNCINPQGFLDTVYVKVSKHKDLVKKILSYPKLDYVLTPKELDLVRKDQFENSNIYKYFDLHDISHKIEKMSKVAMRKLSDNLINVLNFNWGSYNISQPPRLRFIHFTDFNNFTLGSDDKLLTLSDFASNYTVPGLTVHYSHGHIRLLLDGTVMISNEDKAASDIKFPEQQNNNEDDGQVLAKVNIDMDVLSGKTEK